MSQDLGSTGHDARSLFRPFTRESLATIEAQRADGHAKQKRKKKGLEGEVRDEGPQPDATLEQGLPLPVRMQGSFPLELASTPLEDIDPFYHNQRTFMVIDKRKYIYRFSATKALWLLGPFNPIRRAAINILFQPLFSLLIICTILVNCIFMILPLTPTIESTEILFTGIYTLEFVVKVVARGFILNQFTYLRDPWNWLDFILLILAYLTFGIDIENLAVLRALRVFRALKTVAIAPGLRTIADAVIKSIKNLHDVIILIIFSLSVFALIGLQLYMGVLTQKCIKIFPQDGTWGNLTDESWELFTQNETNWYEEDGIYPLCGNSTGAGICESGYVCLQGYGSNPNYGYTNFDTFSWAFLSAFQLMTQDYWENLYKLVLRATGPWHIFFFMVTIILGSFYLLNLILAIVVKSYDKLQKKAEEEKQAKKALMENNRSQTAAEAEIATEENVTPLSTTSAITGEIVPKDNEEQPTTCKNCCMKGIDFCCVWDCCWLWVKFQKCLGLLVFDPFFELFIILCLVLNTLFMALDHHDMDRDMERILRTGNYFFITIFGIEAVLKITAMSPKYYFREKWNIFDFTIVMLSLLELALEGVHGLSILRSLRLLRVFRLVKSWPTFNLVMSIVGKTTGALINLTFVLCIIIFIFAVMGMQLFGKNYVDNVDRFPEGDLPRWNFTDFMHSFMMVFRVLCGEWIESMWDCMLVGDITCVPFFVAAVVITNLVLLNLFLALLLSNFSLSAPIADQNTSKLAEAFNRISNFILWIKQCVVNLICATGRNKREKENTATKYDINTDKNKDKQLDCELTHYEYPTQVDDSVSPTSYESHKESAAKKHGEKKKDNNKENTPADCCPVLWYRCFPSLAGDDNSTFWQRWGTLRLKTFKIVENKYFEGVVLTVILLSSLALALEDINLPYRPLLREILFYMDIVFTVIFVIEMLIKWLALGFKEYFTSAWCWLDFIIVVLSLMNHGAAIAGVGDIPLFRSMRTLRALRPLRAVSRWEGMRVVVYALVKAIPSMFSVLLVCLFFWLIFAIIGVQLFAGKFYKCVDMNYTTFSHEFIPDRNACVSENYLWENSPMNFDHIGNAYLSLFQVSTFKGWIQIMNDAIDSREVGKQPIRETNIYMYLYFVLFIIIGSFFTRGLLISVIFNKFKEQKQKAGGSLDMFMTEDQKKYYHAMKMGSKSFKTIPRPKWRLQAKVFDIVTNKKFDMTIMIFIGLNMIVLMFEHYQQSETLSLILDYLNMIFIIIFTIECILKIFALRHHYFLDRWNLFDFVVVVTSVLGLVLSDIIEKYFVSPTLLRIVRLAKIGRVLRLVKSSKGIRTLLHTLAMSMPALFNICLLLFLVMFIYAIFGMSFFMHVKNQSGIDDVYNFKTFGQSMIMLFQISTTAGWDGVLHAITNEEDCELPDKERGSPGNCGSEAIGITYLVSYIILSYFIFINMFIAVILDNYSQATEDVQEGLTEDDYDMFCETWQRFNPDGSQYIRYDQLSDLLDMLEPPLRIPKPNKDKIASLGIPICRGDMMFCCNILEALIKDFFARKGTKIEMPGDAEAKRPDFARSVSKYVDE
ncbi:hypothetical protein O3G_MSEX003637 [Manduca sexta]|uniref:Ion transport domain-containing protein n=1 Tax=Manduca sexta TaxID=7130 RepID=A0A921YS67_MANSE|nr:hypothetical protein O3G_MSEX003637 [Manduca sexta]